MKKVLVLGGNGFIGKNLCTSLLKRNVEVYSFDMKEPEDKTEGINYLEGDFFDDYTLSTILRDMDVVYHAVCTMNPGNSNDKYIMGYERDLIQTIKLCDMLKNTATRLVFLSSGGTVYGIQDKMPIVEETIPVPINHYGNLKLCIENTLMVFAYQQKADIVIARIANPYGPGQDYRKGVGFIDAVIKHAISGTSVELWGDGSVIRDYIYIDDVCYYLGALIDYSGPYHIINISSGVGVSQKQIIDIVKSINPGLKIEKKDKRAVDVPVMVLDNSRMKEIADYELLSIEDGINRYYKYVDMR